jgi:hypothetical protein
MGRLIDLTGVALLGAAAVGAGLGCRERAEAVQSEADLRDMVRRMMPSVAQAAQLSFKREPLVLRRSRDQVRDYVVHKFDQDLPPAELKGLEAALHLFGLIPDTMQLRPTMIDLLTEQIAGYYDADSNALYIPADIEPSQLRVVVSHELVHALQDQYVSLDSIITQQGHNDRRSAAQAVLEGQATVAQISVLMPEQRPDTFPVGWFWRQRVVTQRLQGQMAQFSRAPLWLREGLIFPYLGGADFIVWFRRNRPGRSVLTAMPTSTEQILHPDRYAEGDAPTPIAFTGPSPDSVWFEDDLGEFETRLLLEQHLGDERQATQLATGWDGDRYQVLGRAADALVWYTVWDDAAAADRFAAGLERAWRKRRADPEDRRSEIKRVDIDGRPGVRLVDAPGDWRGWKQLPQVSLRAKTD